MNPNSGPLFHMKDLMTAMITHRTRQVAVLVPPARGAGAGSVDGVAGRPVGTLTRLIAARSPSTAGARDGAVHTLPTWTNTPSRDHQATANLSKHVLYVTVKHLVTL